MRLRLALCLLVLADGFGSVLPVTPIEAFTTIETSVPSYGEESDRVLGFEAQALYGLFKHASGLQQYYKVLMLISFALEETISLPSEADYVTLTDLLIILKPIAAGGTRHASTAKDLYEIVCGLMYIFDETVNATVLHGRAECIERAYVIVQASLVNSARYLIDAVERVGLGYLCSQGASLNVFAIPTGGGCFHAHELFRHFQAWTSENSDALGVQTHIEYMCPPGDLDTPVREVECAHRIGTRRTRVEGKSDDPIGPFRVINRSATFAPCLGPCGIDDEYFQWIGVLEAVRESYVGRESGYFSMIELGSDFGPWTSRALAAWRRLDTSEDYHTRCSVIGLEYNLDYAARFLRHITDNGLSCAHMASVKGSVGELGGDNAQLADMIAQLRLPPGRRVSLVHMDVQGKEAHVIRNALRDGSLKQVRWLIIGTHSRALHHEVLAMLESNSWQLHCNVLPLSVAHTPFGPVMFRDGLLVAASSEAGED